MRSTTSSTSSMGSAALDDDECASGGRRRRLAAGKESRAVKGAGLQSSILQAILVDPLPMATPIRVHIAARPPSISIAEDDGKENDTSKRRREDTRKDRSRSVEDDEVFAIIASSRIGIGSDQQDSDQVDVTMSTPISPLTPTASEMTLLAPAVERTVFGSIKNASSFLDVTSASTSSSVFNRSNRPKSLALEELPEGWREWLRACTDGDIEGAKKVLRNDPTMINWSPPLTGRLAGLHLASRGNHLKMVTWLVLQGADVNQQTLSGYTPLHIAAQQTNRGMVYELRRLGADESRCDFFGRRYDHYASWKEDRQTRSIESFRSCTSGPSTVGDSRWVAQADGRGLSMLVMEESGVSVDRPAPAQERIMQNILVVEVSVLGRPQFTRESQWPARQAHLEETSLFGIRYAAFSATLLRRRIQRRNYTCENHQDLHS